MQAAQACLSHTTEEPSLRLPWQESQLLYTPSSVTSERWEFFFDGTSHALGTGPWGTLGCHEALTAWLGLFQVIIQAWTNTSYCRTALIQFSNH